MLLRTLELVLMRVPALAEVAIGRGQLSLGEKGSRFFGSALPVNNYGLNAVLHQIVGCSPAHAVAECRLAIVKCLDKAGMAVRLVSMSGYVAVSCGVGSVRVLPKLFPLDNTVFHIKYDKKRTTPKMGRDRVSILRSYCNSHISGPPWIPL
jgi:hypothetical protein